MQHSGILDRIIAVNRDRASFAAARAAEWRARAADAPPPRDFMAALAAPGLQIIAEIKRRSPSAGDLAADLDAGAAARAYEAGGAAAVSVLTEEVHFGGSITDLVAARFAVGLPLLRKDFLVNGGQIWEARAAGADAVLLIMAILDEASLRRQLAAADEAGMTALVEVHSEPEAERALASGARCIGVNNRDLTTFVTDLSVAERIAPVVSGEAIRVAESGVSNGAGAERMRRAGFDAVLVGEALVTAADPGALIAALRGGR